MDLLENTSPGKRANASAKKKLQKAHTAAEGSLNAKKTTTDVDSGPVSVQYEQRGYTEAAVSKDHWATLESELHRERAVTVSVQADNTMLREQLARANEAIKGLEKVREI